MENMVKVEQKKKVKNFGVVLGDIYRKWGIFIILILMILIMGFLTPTFFTVTNLVNVLKQISINALIAFGVTFVIITGGIDLSSGSILALVGVIVASLAHPNQYPLIVPVLVGIIIGVVAGAVNGTIIALTNIPPFIVTLGMMTIARGVALLYTDGQPISNLSDEFNFIGGGHLLGIPFPIIIMIIFLIISHFLLNNTKFGSYTYAIGGNEQAAIVSGVNVKNTKFLSILMLA